MRRKNHSGGTPPTASSRLAADRGSNGGYSLIVGGVTQSHVNPDDPTDLQLDYVRRIGNVVDAVAPQGAPLRTLHLGSGGMTIARYIAATRPGSHQDAVELDPEIVDTVLTELPLPSDAKVTVRVGDARAVAEQLRADHGAEFDLVIVDVFSGAVAPLHVATSEFMGVVDELLAPGGVVIVNVLTQGSLDFARHEAATLAAVFGSVAAVVRPGVLRGGAGNVVLLAGRGALPNSGLRELLASDPRDPALLLTATEVAAFARRARPLVDARLRGFERRRRLLRVRAGALRRARRLWRRLRGSRRRG